MLMADGEGRMLFRRLRFELKCEEDDAASEDKSYERFPFHACGGLMDDCRRPVGDEVGGDVSRSARNADVGMEFLVQELDVLFIAT